MTEPRRYRVDAEKSVERVLRRLPQDVLRRLLAAMERLGDDPRPRGCKRLKGKQDLYRVRVGDWRISYAIYDDSLVIVVVEVAPRSGAYRGL